MTRTVKDQIGILYESYVVDLAIDTNGRVFVIEINPFWNKTGPALFSTLDYESGVD